MLIKMSGDCRNVLFIMYFQIICQASDLDRTVYMGGYNFNNNENFEHKMISIFLTSSKRIYFLIDSTC